MDAGMGLQMDLTKRQRDQLATIVRCAQKVKIERAPQGKPRRTRAESAAMRQEILVALKNGEPAARLAEKYNVSLPYIYMIKSGQ